MASQRTMLEPWTAKVLAFAGDAIICVDETGRIFFFNRAAESVFGYAADDVLGRRIGVLMPWRSRRVYREQVRALAPGTNLRREGTGRRKGGGEFPFEASLSRQQLDGRNVLIVSVREVSDRQREREAEELLVRERGHRMRNILATVQAIGLQTLRANPSPAAFAEAFADRLAALSQIHDLLIRSRWQGAAVQDLVRQELRPYASEKHGNVLVQGDAFFLRPEAALSLSLALHELATNAAKYGALSVPEGRVEVSWGLENGDADRRLKLHWAERGGPEVHEPERDGFGRTLLERGIVHSLGGTVDLKFLPAGVRCGIELPLGSDT